MAPVTSDPQVFGSEMTDYIAEDLRALAVDIDSIRPDPSNAREHDERNLETIANSLEEFGQRTPLVVQRKEGKDDVIRKGNGTWRAAKERLGWDEIAVIRVEEDDTTSTAYAIADNRTQELSAWNDQALERLLGSLPDSDLELTGFEPDEIEALDPNFDFGVDESTSSDDKDSNGDDLPDIGLTDDDYIEAEITVFCSPEDEDEIRDRLDDILKGFEDARIE